MLRNLARPAAPVAGRPAGWWAVIVAILLASAPNEARAAAEDESQPLAGHEVDPCQSTSGEDKSNLERVRSGVFSSVCATSRWFDSFFGDPRDYAEVYGRTYGRIGLGLVWDELDDLGFDSHLRANFPLPALGERYDAVIGRETDDHFIDDDIDEIGYLPGSFSDDPDPNWYAGINYNTLQNSRSRFDLGVGVEVDTPLNPYVKARYRYLIDPRDDQRVTLRATAFWENDDGFGLTLGADSDWRVSEDWLLRWANTGTFSEATEGVRWKSRLSLYQVLGPSSAMRYEVGVRGQSDGVDPDLYTVKATYRRSVWRRWFFVETSGGIFWAYDEDPDQRCNACVSVGIGFDMMFGDRYDSQRLDSQAPPPEHGDVAAPPP